MKKYCMDITEYQSRESANTGTHGVENGVSLAREELDTFEKISLSKTGGKKGRIVEVGTGEETEVVADVDA